MDNNEFCQCRVIHQDRIKQAREKALDQDEVNSIALIFKTMGDPSRIRILWSLSHKEMCVCDLAAFLGISESAVSHQLRTLRQMALVANRRQGPILYYRLNDGHVSELVQVALAHAREPASNIAADAG